MLERISQTDPTDIAGTREVLHNNIAFTGPIIRNVNLADEDVSNNSWNTSGISVSAADFQSLDATQLSAPRGKDGALPNVTFMHLTSGSDLLGLGCF